MPSASFYTDDETKQRLEVMAGSEERSVSKFLSRLIAREWIERNSGDEEFLVRKEYLLQLKHVGKVTDLADRSGVSQGAVVQKAIDRLYDAIQKGLDALMEEEDSARKGEDDGK